MQLVLPDRPFTSTEAPGLGISRRQLRDAVDGGLVVRLFTGVYVAAELPDTTELRALAARLVVSASSVVCDRSAAWLHGIDVFRYSELDSVPQLETCVLRGHDPTDRPGILGRTRDLAREDCVEVAGVWVTTPLRTAADLACCLRRREAMAALDAFARTHGVTTRDLRRLLVRYFRRRGVIQARELAGLIEPLCESMRESWVHLELHDRRLPRPVAQYWVMVDGVPTYRLDFAYPHARVAIEYDGEDWHASPEQRQADELRRAWLREHGWIVIVLTKESFSEEACQRWTDEVRTRLDAARSRRP